MFVLNAGFCGKSSGLIARRTAAFAIVAGLFVRPYHAGGRTRSPTNCDSSQQTIDDSLRLKSLQLRGSVLLATVNAQQPD